MNTITTIFAIYRTLITRIITILAILVAAALLWYGSTKPPRIVQLDPITKVIEVPVDKITEKTITKYVKVEDRAAIKKLLNQNKKLKADVQQLTVALANSVSSGSGQIVYSPAPPDSYDHTPSQTQTPRPFTFADWRLNLRSLDGVNATYTLSQQFTIVNTVGRNAQNVPVNVIGLFEINDKGERVAIPISEITTIAAQQDRAKFYLKPSLQAGVGIIPRVDSADAKKLSTGFVLTIPWFKHGAKRVIETTRYAYLSPAAVIDGKRTIVGIMPISINTGTFKYTPFSDIWASPLIGINASSQKHFGVVFSATF